MLLPSKSNLKPAFSSSALSLLGSDAGAAAAGLSSARAGVVNETNAGAASRAAIAAVTILGERVMGVSLSACRERGLRARDRGRTVAEVVTARTGESCVGGTHRIRAATEACQPLAFSRFEQLGIAKTQATSECIRRIRRVVYSTDSI